MQPLRVALMDDDFHSLKWNTALFMRDPRTTVVIEAESPQELQKELAEEEQVDIIVVDVEYKPDEPPLAALLAHIHKVEPEATLVCLSQYGEKEKIDAALEQGALGFLLKNEIRMAIVPAILKAYYDGLTLTKGIAARIDERDLLSLNPAAVLPRWKANPGLTPQLRKSFWLRVFFGMRAALAAEELYVETATIERYVNLAYKILPDGWADDSYLFNVEMETISPEDQAFLWFTLPPKEG